MANLVEMKNRFNVDLNGNYVMAIERAVINIKNSSFIIGENLLKIKDQMEAAGEGKMFIEAAEQLFGFKKSNTYNFMKLYETFGHDQEKFGGFSSSQLTEMLTMDSQSVQEIKPEMTISEIREIKRDSAPVTIDILDGHTRDEILRKILRMKIERVRPFFERTARLKDKEKFLKDTYYYLGGTWDLLGKNKPHGYFDCSPSGGLVVTGHDGKKFKFTWANVAKKFTEFIPPTDDLFQDHQVTDPDQPAAASILTAELTLHSDHQAADPEAADIIDVPAQDIKIVIDPEAKPIDEDCEIIRKGKKILTKNEFWKIRKDKDVGRKVVKELSELAYPKADDSFTDLWMIVKDIEREMEEFGRVDRSGWALGKKNEIWCIHFVCPFGVYEINITQQSGAFKIEYMLEVSLYEINRLSVKTGFAKTAYKMIDDRYVLKQIDQGMTYYCDKSGGNVYNNYFRKEMYLDFMILGDMLK